RIERGLQLVARGAIEPGADLAGVAQLAIVVVADEQRAESAAQAALPGDPAADDHLLAPDVLDLEPVAGAFPRSIPAGQPLGDDAFQASSPGGLEQRSSLARVIGGHLPVRAAEAQGLELAAAVFVSQREQRAAVVVQQ